jgi:hypothetical protein
LHILLASIITARFCSPLFNGPDLSRRLVHSLSGNPSQPPLADVTLMCKFRGALRRSHSRRWPRTGGHVRSAYSAGTRSRLRLKSCKRVRPLPELLVTNSIKSTPCTAGTLDCTTSNKDENGVVWRRTCTQICFLGSCRYVDDGLRSGPQFRTRGDHEPTFHRLTKLAPLCTRGARTFNNTGSAVSTPYTTWQW